MPDRKSHVVSDEAAAIIAGAPDEKPFAPDLSDPTAVAAERKAAHEHFFSMIREDLGSFRLKDEPVGGVEALIVDGAHVTSPDSVLLHLHGGYYAMLEPRTSLAYTARIAQLTGRRIVSPHYALAPERPFPHGLHDCRRVYLGLLDQGIAPEKIGVFGESAGGGLAVALALLLRENNEPLPSCLALIAPWADIGGRGDSYSSPPDHDPFQTFAGDYEVFGHAYAGSTPLDDPLLSPVYADLTGMPPMLLQTGSRDILLSDSLTLDRNARAAGVDVTLDVWEGMPHMWHVYSAMPEARTACQELATFLIRYT